MYKVIVCSHKNFEQPNNYTCCCAAFSAFQVINLKTDNFNTTLIICHQIQHFVNACYNSQNV